MQRPDAVKRMGNLRTDDGGTSIARFSAWCLDQLVQPPKGKPAILGNAKLRATVLFPRACCVCFELGTISGCDTIGGGSGARQLTPCSSCRQAWHCAKPACVLGFVKAHPQEGAVCQDATAALLAALAQPGAALGMFSPRRQPKPLLPPPESWEAYRAARLAAGAVIGNLELDRGSVLLALQRHTQALTILRALHAAPSIDCAAATTLSIHILQAQWESTTHQQLELLMHCLPNLKHLYVRLIGSSLQPQHFPATAKALSSTSEGTIEDSAHQPVPAMCPACSASGRQLHLAMSVGTYHHHLFRASWDGPKSPPKAWEPTGAPDLLVVLNPCMYTDEGPFSPSSPWAPTMAMVVTTATPMLVTATNEWWATRDADILRLYGFSFLAGTPALNPCPSPVPFPEPAEFLRYSTANKYWMLCLPDDSVDVSLDEVRAASKAADQAQAQAQAAAATSAAQK